MNNTYKLNYNIHFQKSLYFLKISNYNKAIKHIDLAISESRHKSFYKYQKIKLLYIAKMFSQCSNYIENNLFYLYTHSSTHIFSKIIYYLKVSSDYTTKDVEKLLVANKIPTIFAHEYRCFIDNPNIDIYKAIHNLETTEDYKRCIEYCNLFLSKYTSDINCYLIKARCHCALSQYTEAIYIYKEILNYNTKTPSIYYELGSIFIKTNEYPQAILYLELAHKMDPFKVKYINSLAKAYYLWRKYDSALFYYKKILRIDPKCMEALVYIGNIYELINKPRKAKKYYKKCH